MKNVFVLIVNLSPFYLNFQRSWTLINYTRQCACSNLAKKKSVLPPFHDVRFEACISFVCVAILPKKKARIVQLMKLTLSVERQNAIAPPFAYFNDLENNNATSE